MHIKSHILFILLLAFAIMMTNTAYSKENIKTSEILDNNDLPGFYLIRFTQEIEKWDDVIDKRPVQKDIDKMNPDLGYLKSTMIIFNSELWSTFSKKEWKNRKEIKKGKKPYLNIQIDRNIFGSKDGAILWLKMCFVRHPMNEGSFSGDSIGDICWSKSEGDSLRLMCFVKGNTVVRVIIQRKNGYKTDCGLDEYTERIAKTIVSRL